MNTIKPLSVLAVTALLSLSPAITAGQAFAAEPAHASAAVTSTKQANTPPPIKMRLTPNSDSLGFSMKVSDGAFKLRSDGTPVLLDSRGNVNRIFKTGKQTLKYGYVADLTYKLVDSHQLVVRAHVLNNTDRSCIGDGLLFGSAVIGSIAAAPETLGGSVAAGLLVAGSEWNALDSCFGH